MIPQSLIDALVEDRTSPTWLRWKEWTNGRKSNLVAGYWKPGRPSIGWMGKIHPIGHVLHVLRTGEQVPKNHVMVVTSDDKFNLSADSLKCVPRGVMRKPGHALGCWFDKGVGKWRAQITENRRKRNIGTYNSRQEAAEAYLAEYNKRREEALGLR